VRGLRACKDTYEVSRLGEGALGNRDIGGAVEGCETRSCVCECTGGVAPALWALAGRQKSARQVHGFLRWVFRDAVFCMLSALCGV